MPSGFGRWHLGHSSASVVALTDGTKSCKKVTGELRYRHGPLRGVQPQATKRREKGSQKKRHLAKMGTWLSISSWSAQLGWGLRQSPVGRLAYDWSAMVGGKSPLFRQFLGASTSGWSATPPPHPGGWIPSILKYVM